MTKKKLKLCALFLFGLGLTGIQAQEIHETIPATGGNASGSGGSVSYSVGQVVYTTNTGTNGSVAQGVQQPFEISEVIEGIEQPGININCSVYPNPTTDFIVLEIDFSTEVFYQLYDAIGNLVDGRKVTDATTNIGMNCLVSGTYFLKILKEGRIVKTYKIIKSK